MGSLFEASCNGLKLDILYIIGVCIYGFYLQATCNEFAKCKAQICLSINWQLSSKVYRRQQQTN